jgi:hypothetical protein
MENSENSVENKIFLKGAAVAAKPVAVTEAAADETTLGVDIFPPVLTSLFKSRPAVHEASVTRITSCGDLHECGGELLGRIYIPGPDTERDSAGPG